MAGRRKRTLLDLLDAVPVSAAVLAARIGVTRQTIYAWSQGRHRPDDAMVAELARELGVGAEAASAVLARPKKRGAPRKH